LDTNTNTWTNLTPIPGGGFLNTTAVYLPDTDRVYLPGGSIQASDQAYSREHKYYDFDTSIWDTASEEVGGDNVTEAFAYAAAAPNNAEDGYFLTGGVVGQGYPITTTSTVLDQVLFYQPSSDEWTTKTAMTSPRYGHVAANVSVNDSTTPGRELCVAGGLNIVGGQIELVTGGECASGVSPSVTWSATGSMQVPRYFAHSSVGPDGKWYVYGGIDEYGGAVPEVEYYDPATNSWSVLGLLYDVGGQDGRSVVWPGGGFVDNYLWMAGGSFDPTGNDLNPQTAKVQILGGSLYLPLIVNQTATNNHNFSEALYIHVNTAVSQKFSSSRELVNVYKFEVNRVSTINVALTSVASSANVNLYLFGDNKDLLQSDESPFPGVDKTISMPLGQGTYYVVVRYLFSTNPDDINDYYQLGVSE